jgi:hypothetical protein
MFQAQGKHTLSLMRQQSNSNILYNIEVEAILTLYGHKFLGGCQKIQVITNS